jgi:AraC-like DNA-binding protein
MTAHASPGAHSPTASVRYLGALFDYLRLRGISEAALLGGAAVPQGDDARISEHDAAALFNRAAALTGDDALGLHAGEHIRPGHYGALGYVAMACSTLGEALLCQQRYQRLVLDIGPPQLSLEKDAVVISWQTDPDPLYRQLAEFNFAGLLSFIRWITGQPLVPLRLDFIYAAPVSVTEHQRVLGCPLRFKQSHYCLAVPAAWQSLPLIQPDPAMRQLMDRLAEQQMLTLAQADDPIARARGLIAKTLGVGEVELAAIAGALHVSPRSFQRKLQEQGQSFTQLVDGVRRELAERYLADAALDLTDIAFLLGFSEQSAFTRAYKRWNGRAPTAVRGR